MTRDASATGHRRDRRMRPLGRARRGGDRAPRRRAKPRSRVGTNFADRALAVLLTDDAAIRRLNAQWRGIDKPTNVLSFPPAPQHAAPLRRRSATSRSPTRPPRARPRPRASRSPHHLAHLAVHGFLHLLGYDHESDAQAEAMEQLERAILARARRARSLPDARAKQSGSDLNAMPDTDAPSRSDSSSASAAPWSA